MPMLSLLLRFWNWVSRKRPPYEPFGGPWAKVQNSTGVDCYVKAGAD